MERTSNMCKKNKRLDPQTKGEKKISCWNPAINVDLQAEKERDQFQNQVRMLKIS